MKITFKNYNIYLELNRYEKNVIVIENSMLLRKIVLEILNMTQNTGEKIFLSEDEQIFKFKELVDILVSPFDMNLNSKKIQNKLYGNLKKKAYDEMFFEKTMQVQSYIMKYLYELESDSEFIFSINEMDIVDIFKSFEIKIEESNDLIENLDYFIKIAGRLLKIKILFLVNFTNYFSKEEIELIQKTAIYEEIILIFIESEDKIKSNNKIVIDRDQCRII